MNSILFIHIVFEAENSVCRNFITRFVYKTNREKHEQQVELNKQFKIDV